MQDTFSQENQQRIQQYVTNCDRDIYALKNVPPTVAAALLARYSRSKSGVRKILVDEFLDQLGDSQDHYHEGRAESFHDKVFSQYGDDSVAELATTYICCENVSNIAAKALEDNRVGISPLEKSSRYVVFDPNSDGIYPYYRVPCIMNSDFGYSYEKEMDFLFREYCNIFSEAVGWVRRFFENKTSSETSYLNAVKAKTLDMVRGLLPMSTLTNVGLHGNALAFEHLLTKMLASPHAEVRAIASSMHVELSMVVPSFMKRVTGSHGTQKINYLIKTREDSRSVSQTLVADYLKHRLNTSNSTQHYPNPALTLPSITLDNAGATVTLLSYDPHAEDKICAAILHDHCSADGETLKEIAYQMNSEMRRILLKSYTGDRLNRRHKPGRAFEKAVYIFEFLCDIGSYRDLQRHRMLTPGKQDFTTAHGFSIPNEIVEAGLAEDYSRAMFVADDLFSKISVSMPEAAQYVVPFGYKVRWQITLSLREIYHIVELRTQPQGHSSYRAIAQSIYTHVKKVHPLLIENMKFVDLGYYGLGRLKSEQKIEEASLNPFSL